MEWNKRIHEMTREELEIFAIHTLGLVSTCPPFDMQTPQEVFEYIDTIGKGKEDE